MSRPRLFRDPIHGQIKYKRVDLAAAVPTAEKQDERMGWLIPRLINCPEFQRLRHIRQNGLTNLVFHGAEHSRFSHSMGASYLAGEMYDRIMANMDYPANPQEKLAVIAASLVHDVGHGPFSHAMEEVLEELKVPFDHEYLSLRIIEDEESHINEQFRAIDLAFPSMISPFINKTNRNPDHWTYRLVSSQLDADRLDYLVRDARQAGLQGHGFDMPRLLDMLYVLPDGIRIAVDRHAIEAVEAYLLMLEHLYRAIYFHRAARGATILLISILRRAATLYSNGDRNIFPVGSHGREHPLQLLIEKGQNIELSQYLRLGEFHVWNLIEEWQDNEDRVLSDLSRRLMHRAVFRVADLNPADISGTFKLREFIEKSIKEELPFVDDTTLDFYMVLDEPSRTSYKRYDWMTASADESIWLLGGPRHPSPIEEEAGNEIIGGLKKTKYFQRLVFPHEILDRVNSFIRS